MDCPDGCLCDSCCEQARSFAYANFALHDFDDFADVRQLQGWQDLGDGCYRRTPKLTSNA